jgi:hypothetical protein
LAQPAQPCFGCSYVASHHLAVTRQSGAKDKFCYTVYNITLNSNCEAQRISKNLEKNVEDQKSKLAIISE